MGWLNCWESVGPEFQLVLNIVETAHYEGIVLSVGEVPRRPQEVPGPAHLLLEGSPALQPHGGETIKTQKNLQTQQFYQSIFDFLVIFTV